MPAPLLGLPALLQAIATISVGGAIGYKAQKDLQPYIKELKKSPEDMDTPQLKMLRALLLPNQALASELKDMTTSKSVGLTGEGYDIGPRVEDIEREQEEIRQVTKPGVSKPAVEPITKEIFPAEPEQKPEPPVQPEIQLEKKETFPDLSEEINIPIIYNMKDGKPQYKYPTEEEIKEYINEENEFWKQNAQRAKENYPEFSAENMPQLVEADKHFGAAAYSFQNFDDSKLIYMSPDEYLSLTKKFRPVEGKEQLGSKMNVKNLENILREGGELANIPTLYIKKPFEGLDTFEVVGQEGNHRAKAFKNLGYDKIPVVVEGYTRDDKQKTKNVFPTSIVSFSNYNKEKEEYEQYDSVQTKPTDFYNVLTKEKLFSTPEAPALIGTKAIPETPAIVGTKAQEGGKQIKDITAGFSVQKDIVPSLLEQGKAATPMKNFFEKDTNVINYKIGDTIGAYGGDVERSLDIEANVKPDFNIDNFSEVIKQGAKEYNQDAVFVAESAPPEKANTVGFSIDFGSNLNIADALEVSKRISDTAQLDGFTFKVKNLDTSGASIYLPQEKDLEMTQKVMEKFKPTDQINLAGFMMPDGRMLNFSRSGNVRDTEHRRIGLTTHPGSDGISFGPMYDFMNKTGAIRLAGNTNRLYAEISGKPSTTQIRKIAEEYNKNRDRYDSLTIALAIPKTEGALGGVKPEEAIDLSKMTYRLPNEAFIEINGTEANANDIFKKFQAADVMGKTFTGIRQLNIPEFSGMSPDEAAQKIINLGNNMLKIIEETGIKTLDKPKTKSYNVKLFQKGKDY